MHYTVHVHVLVHILCIASTSSHLLDAAMSKVPVHSKRSSNSTDDVQVHATETTRTLSTRTCSQQGIYYPEVCCLLASGSVLTVLRGLAATLLRGLAKLSRRLPPRDLSARR